MIEVLRKMIEKKSMMIGIILGMVGAGLVILGLEIEVSLLTLFGVLFLIPSYDLYVHGDKYC